MSVACRMEKEGVSSGKTFNNSCLEWQWSLFHGEVRHIVRYTSSWNHFTIYVNDKVVAKESKKKGIMQKKKKTFQHTFQTDTGAEATLQDDDGVVMLLPSVKDVTSVPMPAAAPSSPSKQSVVEESVTEQSVERDSARSRPRSVEDDVEYEDEDAGSADNDDLHVEDLGEAEHVDTAADDETLRSKSAMGAFEFEVIVLCDGERKTGLVWRCVDDGLECIRVDPNSPLAEWNMMRTGRSSYGQPRDIREGDLVVAVNEETESTEMIQILNNSRDQEGTMVLLVRRNAISLLQPDEERASCAEVQDTTPSEVAKESVVATRSAEAASASFNSDQDSIGQDSGALLQELENEEAQRLSEDSANLSSRKKHRRKASHEKKRKHAGSEHDGRSRMSLQHDALPHGDSALKMTLPDDGINSACSAQSRTTQSDEAREVKITAFGGDTCPSDIPSALDADKRRSVSATEADITEWTEMKGTNTIRQEDKKAKRRRRKELEMGEGTDGKKSEDREKKVKRRKSKDESREERNERRRLSKEGKHVVMGASSSSHDDKNKLWEASFDSKEQRASSSAIIVGSGELKSDAQRSTASTRSELVSSDATGALAVATPLISPSTYEDACFGFSTGHCSAGPMNDAKPCSVLQQSIDDESGARSSTVSQSTENSGARSAPPEPVGSQNAEARSASPATVGSEIAETRSVSSVALLEEKFDALSVSPLAHGIAVRGSENLDALPVSPLAQRSATCGTAAQGSEQKVARPVSPSAHRTAAQESENEGEDPAFFLSQRMTAKESEIVGENRATTGTESLLVWHDVDAEQNNENNLVDAVVCGDEPPCTQTRKEAWARETSDDVASPPAQARGELPSMDGSASRSEYFDGAATVRNVLVANAVRAQAEEGDTLVTHRTPVKGTGVIDEKGNALTTRDYFEDLGLSDEEDSVSVDAHPDQTGAADNEGLHVIPTVAEEVSAGQAPSNDLPVIFFIPGHSDARMNSTSGGSFVNHEARHKHAPDEHLPSSVRSPAVQGSVVDGVKAAESQNVEPLTIKELEEGEHLVEEKVMEKADTFSIGMASATGSPKAICEHTPEQSVAENDGCVLKVDAKSPGSSLADELCIMKQARQSSKGAISPSSSSSSVFALMRTSEPTLEPPSPLGQQKEPRDSVGADNEVEPSSVSQTEGQHSLSVSQEEESPCNDSKLSSHRDSLDWVTASLEGAAVAKLELLSETDEVTFEAPAVNKSLEPSTVIEQVAQENSNSQPESVIDDCPWGFPPDYGDDFTSRHSSLDEPPWGLSEDPRANDDENTQSRGSFAHEIFAECDQEETPLEAAAPARGEEDPAFLLDQNDSALLPEDSALADRDIDNLEETPFKAVALLQGESDLQTDQDDIALRPKDNRNAHIQVDIFDQEESPPPLVMEALPSTPLSSAAVALHSLLPVAVPEQCGTARPQTAMVPPLLQSRSPTDKVTTSSTTPMHPERTRLLSSSPVKRSHSPQAAISLYARTAQQRGLSPALNRTIKHRSKSPTWHKVSSFWNEFQRRKLEARKKDKFPRVQDILNKVRAARQRSFDEEVENDSQKEQSVFSTSVSPSISAGSPSGPVVRRAKQHHPRPLTADNPPSATDLAAKRVSLRKEFWKRLEAQQRNARKNINKVESEKKVEGEFNLSTQCPMSFEGFARKVGVPTQWSKAVKKQTHSQLPSMETRQRNLFHTAHAIGVLPADRAIFSLATGSDTIQYRNPDISMERSQALCRRNFASELRSRKHHESHIF